MTVPASWLHSSEVVLQADRQQRHFRIVTVNIEQFISLHQKVSLSKISFWPGTWLAMSSDVLLKQGTHVTGPVIELSFSSSASTAAVY